MPKFLEDKLKSEYGGNNHAIFGTMNKIGAMKGNKETSLGREMEKKHNKKKKFGESLMKKHEEPDDDDNF